MFGLRIAIKSALIADLAPTIIRNSPIHRYRRVEFNYEFAIRAISKFDMHRFLLTKF